MRPSWFRSPEGEAAILFAAIALFSALLAFAAFAQTTTPLPVPSEKTCAAIYPVSKEAPAEGVEMDLYAIPGFASDYIPILEPDGKTIRLWSLRRGGLACYRTPDGKLHLIPPEVRP